jgi:hypothetical protein
VLEGCDGLGEELTSARKAPADARPNSPAEFFSGEPLGEVILKQAANKASGPAPAQLEDEEGRRRDETPRGLQVYMRVHIAFWVTSGKTKGVLGQWNEVQD